MFLEKSSKKGYPIQFSYHSPAMEAMLAAKAAWTHNWDDHINDTIQQALINHGINYCPSLWNEKYKYKSDCYESKPKFVLGFNEPDKKSQSNISVASAIASWRKINSTIPKDSILVGPACSDDERGKNWTNEFYSQAMDDEIRFDAIGLHFYRQDLYGFGKHHIEELCNKFQKPVVISEFAYINWKSKLSDWHDRNFLNKAITETMRFVEWCETSDLVKGYCIFADYNDHLAQRDDYKYAWKMISHGYLTELYKHYQEI